MAKSNKDEHATLSEARFWWITPLLLAISAGAAFWYAALTKDMLKELKVANELQAEFQSEVLKPVLAIEMSRTMVNAGDANEDWIITSEITNNGQVAAQDVRGYAYHDSHETILTLDQPYSLGKVLLAPGGGTISVNSKISKAEAVAIMDTRKLYFHALAEYYNARHEKYISHTTYRCEYDEGRFLILFPVSSNIVFAPEVVNGEQ